MINTPQGLPTLFAVLMSILDIDGTRIVEDHLSDLETYAVLDPVALILLFIPL
jgi:hypothetical protein